MRISRWLNAAVLSLMLGVPVALFAQQPEERQEPKPEPNQEEARPAEPGRQPDAKPREQDQAKPEKPDQNKADEKAMKQQEKQQEKTDQKANEKAMRQGGGGSRPAGKSAHIPDDKFRANFGRQHTFVVHQPVVVEGRQQFVYSGYTFVFIDPWPVDWAFTDQCYVDYIDGDYFLFDLLHPGVRIALFVSL